MNSFFALIRAIRPKQWLKNLFVFVALVFANRLNSIEDLGRTTLTFVIFCGISSAVYLINDIYDLREDQKHPVKKYRPIASGQLKIRIALLAAMVLNVASLTLAWFVSQEVFLIASTYILLNILYSFGLKKIVFLDVLIIAFGFVLRAVSGAAAIEVTISAWLLICTFFLAVFIGLTKRRQELIYVHNEHNHTRHSLNDYNLPLLDQLITITITATLLSYTLYTFNTAHSKWLVLTIPLVLYGIFRFIYLVQMRQLGEDPLQMLIKDRGLKATVAAWAGLIIGILYFL